MRLISSRPEFARCRGAEKSDKVKRRVVANGGPKSINIRANARHVLSHTVALQQVAFDFPVGQQFGEIAGRDHKMENVVAV